VDTTCTNLRVWALHLAARGWHVFPITSGAKKTPLIDRWEREAARDAAKLEHRSAYLATVDLEFRPPVPYTLIDNSASGVPLQTQTASFCGWR
jgi:hypothetical protein